MKRLLLALLVAAPCFTGCTSTLDYDGHRLIVVTFGWSITYFSGRELETTTTRDTEEAADDPLLPARGDGD